MSPVPDRHFPFPLPPKAWSPDFTEPFICTLFAAFESHNLVIGPCLAVCLTYQSSTYCPRPVYVLPIAYLAHGLPTHMLHICYL